MFSGRIVHPYERSWEKKNKNKNKHACEEQGYANLQSPNSKSLRLGCNAEDEPMLKREAEFSSHTVALPLFSLSGAAQCQNAARAVWRGHTHTLSLSHTHSHASPPHPRRGVSSTAGALPRRWFRGTSVLKTHFHLKKERFRGLLIGLNFAHQMFPSVYSGTGCDYPVITHTEPNKELPGFSPAPLNYRTSAAHRSRGSKLG